MGNKVSIIIPCFNDANFIEQAVQSALDQTYLDKEIIVVDDGSNLKTKLVLKILEPKLDHLITQANNGPSAARNVGIQVATGEYILVLDSDDYFEKDFCGKAISIFRKNSDVKIVSSYGRRFIKAPFGPTIKPAGGDLKNFLVRNASLGTMFRKQDWKDVGGYDEKMKIGLEDWEFYIRLHQNGGRTYIIQEILFLYREKKNSRSHIANLHKYELLSYIYKKHQLLFMNHFDLFVDSLLNKLKSEESQKLRIRNKIEFQLGKRILQPFRILKAWFR